MKRFVWRMGWVLSLVSAALLIGCGGGGSNGGGSNTSKTTPTINWSTPAAITYGTALSATQLNATATAGGASVAGTFSYSPSAGAILNAGSQTLTVTFTPNDATTYNSATASVTLTVNKVTPTIVWDAPMPQGYGSWLNSAGLSAKAVNGGATVAGVFTYSPAAGAFLSTLGSVTLNASFAPTDTVNYNSANATQTLTVVKGSPSLSWTAPAPVTQGAALSSAQLNATANYGVAGTFSYSPALGTVMNTPGTQTLTATFTPNDATNYETVSTTTSLTVTPAVGSAMVDFGAAAQTIRGFGGSEAWAGSAYSSDRMNVLYGSGAGQLGLSIMRLRIAPATWNATTKTATTSAWDAELANGLAAQTLGATIFASPWTPPTNMKTNNDSRSDKTWSGNLAAASYADYAAYLKSYIAYATSKGVNLYAISMQNEPDFDPTNYESCLWTADQMASWAASNGAAAVSGSSVKLMMPESFSFAAGMSNAALSNPTAAANIGVIGGHLYGAAPTYPSQAKSLGKEVWETEHYLDSTAKGSASSWKTNIADALAVAKEVHLAMTLGQYNAYNWWWLVNSNDNEPTGLIDNSNAPTFFGLGLAHFARFVRPDYVRYEATSQPVVGVYLSAYAGNGHQVIVVVNTTSSAVNLPVQINNASVTSLTPYQTTSSASLAAQSAVSVSGGSFTAALPAQSITTYVQ